MCERNDGGPAFPSPADRMPDGSGVCAPEYGMGLRDYFAGQALVGLCAKNGGRWDNAESAYFMADAMLAKRTKDTVS